MLIYKLANSFQIKNNCFDSKQMYMAYLNQSFINGMRKGRQYHHKSQMQNVSNKTLSYRMHRMV